MVYELKLDKDSFTKMESRRKTVELRVCDNSRCRLDIDDIIIFFNNNDRIAVKISALYRYRTFKDLFEEVPPEKCGLTGVKSAAEAAEIMKQYYPDNNVREYNGVLGIKFELISLDDAISEQRRIKEEEFERLFPDGMK